MIPGYIIDPDASKDDLEMAITIALDQGEAIVHTITEEISHKDVTQITNELIQLAFVASYHFHGAKDMFKKFVEMEAEQKKGAAS